MIEQVPIARIVIVEPLTVQKPMVVDVYVTASVELATADNVGAVSPSALLPKAGKSILCEAQLPRVNDPNPALVKMVLLAVPQ